jgi:hypothetical protein
MADQKQIDVIISWTIAAKDLGLVIRPLFEILSGNDQTIQCALLIENFGSELGTAVFTDIDRSPHSGFSSKGYYISILSDRYVEYNRQSFIDTLNDWAYFGDPKLTPDWYTGAY